MTAPTLAPPAVRVCVACAALAALEAAYASVCKAIDAWDGPIRDAEQMCAVYDGKDRARAAAAAVQQALEGQRADAAGHSGGCLDPRQPP
jgi:hypothetical protein